MTRRYFVSYVGHDGRVQGFGAGEVLRDEPVRSAADVDAIAEEIRSQQLLRWVTVLNFRPFED